MNSSYDGRVEWKIDDPSMDLASIAHSEATIAELRADHAFAMEYLKLALEELEMQPTVGLLALRDIIEADAIQE